MSCLSRLLGLALAAGPGLGSLAFSVLLVGRWADLGLFKGVLYSLASAVTGAVFLYLGSALLFGRDHHQNAVEIPGVNAPTIAEAPAIAEAPVVPTTQSLFATGELAADQDISAAGAAPVVAAPTAPADSPESLIRRLARERPNWQVTAPQLAHLANLNLGVADATARQMAQSGAPVEVTTGAHGETIYIFRLAESGDSDFQ